MQQIKLNTMLNILYQVEHELTSLLKSQELHSKYIDYHDPVVSRIWFQYGEYRVYLHKIMPCKTQPLFHPHPWKSAVRLLKGAYDMGLRSRTNIIPKIQCPYCDLQIGSNMISRHIKARHETN